MKQFKFKLTEDTGLVLEYHKTWREAVAAFWKKFNKSTK